MSRVARNVELLKRDNVFTGKCKTRIDIIKNSSTNVDELMKKI